MAISNYQQEELLPVGASQRLEPVIKYSLFLSFFQSRFQGPVFRCDKIVVIVALHEANEGIPDKDYNFRGNENFHNLYERLLHERKLKSGYLERPRIYERPLHLRVNLLSRIKANIFQKHGGPQGTPLSQRENTANKNNSLQT